MSIVSVQELGEGACVVWMDCYSTNVVWASFKDGKGQRATVCLDLRVDSPTRNRMFEKGRHPAIPEAVLVELGGEIEGIAVPLISLWLDSEEPRKQGYHEHFLELFKNALLRLGEP